MIFKKAAAIAVFSSALFFFSASHALEDRGGFEIRDFEVGIDVMQDGELVVKESIIVEFFEKRHGIFRNIPIKYRDDRGFMHNLIISDIEVVDEKGNTIAFEKYKESGDLVFKIGDPKIEIKGIYQYNISYEVTRAIRYFDDHSELYWNPIGTQWPTIIDSAKVSVKLPRDYVFGEEDIICFEGAFGESSRRCKAIVAGSKNLEFESSGALNKYEGLTMAIRLPRGYFAEPNWWQIMIWFLSQNWGFLMPVVIFFAMLTLWIQRGKELDLRKTVIPQYDVPDNLTPGEMNYLLKENYSQKAITADVVNLAVKGFLKIKEDSSETEILLSKKMNKKAMPYIVAMVGFVLMLIFVIPAMISFGEGNKFAIAPPIGVAILIILVFFANAKRVKTRFFDSDYELEKTKDWGADKDLTEHEIKLLQGIFGKNAEIGKKIKLSKLADFYSVIPDVKKKLKKQVKDKSYFETNALNYKSIYVIIGVVIFFLFFILGASLQRNDLFFGGFLSAVSLVGFGLAMSKKTSRGAEAYRYVQGFKLYVKTAERYRVRFQEDNNIFEKVLPFAMVFGLAEKWGKVFEDIYKENPNWYTTSSATRGFSAMAFSNSLEHNFSNVARSISTPPSSSSSGFSGGSSGGGGGGGGGGSW